MRSVAMLSIIQKKKKEIKNDTRISNRREQEVPHTDNTVHYVQGRFKPKCVIST